MILSVLVGPSALLAQVSGASGDSTLLTQIVGLFNIFVGLMVVAAFLLYGGGLIMWMTRLGSWPSPRDEAIRIMMWAPVILFTLIVLLAIVQFLQGHPQVGTYIVSTLLLLIVIGIILYIALNAREGKKEEE